MGLPTTIQRNRDAVPTRSISGIFFLHRNRCLPRSRVRLRDRTCGQVRGGLGHTRADGGRAGGGVPSQRRALSNINQDDGLPSFGGRGAETYPTAVRMADRRPDLPQSRDGQQQGQLRVPFHAGRRFHGAQSDAGAQELQPGVDHRRGLQESAHLRLQIRKE